MKVPDLQETNADWIMTARNAILIAVAALGVVAFWKPSSLFSSLLSSLALAANTLMIVGAIIGVGSIRAAAIGYAVCGWGYFLAILVQWSFPEQSPILITSILSYQMVEFLGNGSSSEDRKLLTLAAHSLFMIAAGTAGGLIAWYWSSRSWDLARRIVSKVDQP